MKIPKYTILTKSAGIVQTDEKIIEGNYSFQLYHKSVPFQKVMDGEALGTVLCDFTEMCEEEWNIADLVVLDGLEVCMCIHFEIKFECFLLELERH